VKIAIGIESVYQYDLVITREKELYPLDKTSAISTS